MKTFNFVDSTGAVFATVPVGAVPTGKRELRKLFTLWKNGELSKRQIDTAMGLPQWGGKKIASLWEDNLGIRTFGNGEFSKL